MQITTSPLFPAGRLLPKTSWLSMTSYIWMIQNWSKTILWLAHKMVHTTFPGTSTVLPWWKFGRLNRCMHTYLNAYCLVWKAHSFPWQDIYGIWKEATQQALYHLPANTPKKSLIRLEEYCWDSVRDDPVMVISPHHASWVLVPTTT